MFMHWEKMNQVNKEMGKEINHKPMKIPKLIEPEDGKDKLQLVKNLHDVNTKRLLLLNEWEISKILLIKL